MNGTDRANGCEERITENTVSSVGLAEAGNVRSFLAPTVNAPALGEPISIRDVAALLGCSSWTVRQRYLPQGLPHLRACSGGRIVFFREQVIAWILKRQQQKGGLRK